MKLERTTVGTDASVILTAGGIVKTTDGRWQQIFGMFDTEADAMAEDADDLAIGTVGRDSLTSEQIALAERNVEAIAKATGESNG